MKHNDVKIGETYFDTKGNGHHIVGEEKLREVTTWEHDEQNGRAMFRCFDGSVISARGLFGTKKDLDAKVLADAEAKHKYMSALTAAGVNPTGEVEDPGAFMAAFVNYLNACGGKVSLKDHGWLKAGL